MTLASFREASSALQITVIDLHRVQGRFQVQKDVDDPG